MKSQQKAKLKEEGIKIVEFAKANMTIDSLICYKSMLNI